MKTTREQVYQAIDSERAYQEQRWHGDDQEGQAGHSLEAWLVYIKDYTEEALHTLSRESYKTANDKAIDSLRKIAGLAVAAMEEHGTITRWNK